MVGNNVVHFLPFFPLLFLSKVKYGIYSYTFLFRFVLHNILKQIGYWSNIRSFINTKAITLDDWFLPLYMYLLKKSVKNLITFLSISLIPCIKLIFFLSIDYQAHFSLFLLYSLILLLTMQSAQKIKVFTTFSIFSLQSQRNPEKSKQTLHRQC